VFVVKEVNLEGAVVCSADERDRLSESAITNVHAVVDDSVASCASYLDGHGEVLESIGVGVKWRSIINGEE